MRLQTMHLVAYTILTDVCIAAGVVPFELYCRSAVASHLGNKPFLISLLAANVALTLMMVGAMCASGVLFGRGAKRTAWLLCRCRAFAKFRSDPDGLNVHELVNAES